PRSGPRRLRLDQHAAPALPGLLSRAARFGRLLRTRRSENGSVPVGVPPQGHEGLLEGPCRPEAVALDQEIAEGLGDLVVSLGGKTQPSSNERHGVLTTLEPAAAGAGGDPLEVGIEAELAERQGRIVRGGAGRPPEPVEPAPEA